MTKIEHSFHVDIPVKAKIKFADMLENRESPIFVDILSDKYINFYSYLMFPLEYQKKPVSYLFNFEFLGESFLIKGHIERVLEEGVMKKYEAVFTLSDYERTRLYHLMNHYAILVRNIAKAKKEKKNEIKNTKRKYFSKRI